MKSTLKYLFVLISFSLFAKIDKGNENMFYCGGGEWYDWMQFYNLFEQTNISAEAYYPFLRDEDDTFYGEEDTYYNEDRTIVYPKGNISLWNTILKGWTNQEVTDAIYKSDHFDWSSKTTELEKRAKLYIDFAKKCSTSFNYRNNSNSWDYDVILKDKSIDKTELLTELNTLLKTEKNQQLKARYYYQIIRILHYSKSWNEAVQFYESTIEGKLPKNEIYYYIVDQVAGCYYSIKKYDKAAYLFTKVLNNSIDRKKSAYLSFNFCSNKSAEGKSFFKNIEDEKDLLLIKSLRGFSDEINNINKFIKLDNNDNRVELLFMRALSNVERNVWPKDIGLDNKTLPYLEEDKKRDKLLLIAEQQANAANIKNKDFWKISSSYLSFINKDLEKAKIKLAEVNSFSNQKKVLSIIYEVFSWDSIKSKDEDYIYKVLNDYPINDTNDWVNDSENDDFRNFILDKIAHTYYKNGELAKAFLVHNNLDVLVNTSSLQLLNALNDFYYKQNKSAFETQLLNQASENTNFIDYINVQKGIYYLYNANPEQAVVYFNKSSSYLSNAYIPDTIFSNNIKECFDCEEEKVMVDKVYKAKLFSFIKPSFTKKQLASNLLELIQLTKGTKQSEAKLANYLLANYYYNISNTGYYRGLISGRNSNCCDYNYISYADDNYRETKVGSDVIQKQSGYNLYNLTNYGKLYFETSKTAHKYYQQTIDMSNDNELNARCSYLIAKCELNKYYNEGSNDVYTMTISKYSDIELPKSKGFKLLKENYSDTEFHKLIIKECSYYKYYSSTF